MTIVCDINIKMSSKKFNLIFLQLRYKLSKTINSPFIVVYDMF